MSEDGGNVYDFHKWKKIIEAEKEDRLLEDVENLRSILMDMLDDLKPQFQTFHIPYGDMSYITGSLDDVGAEYWIFEPEDDDDDGC
tara:strand:+ start:544 stop:801 length:258 start_codon:yes stop_codon:yes gene_type:complete